MFNVELVIFIQINDSYCGLTEMLDELKSDLNSAKRSTRKLKKTFAQKQEHLTGTHHLNTF